MHFTYETIKVNLPNETVYPLDTVPIKGEIINDIQKRYIPEEFYNEILK